ncbi:MAG: CHAT domain-containing protein [Scytonematopsis contorta HA4267-MV1]|jgi:CHAT domain-containing protein|nr:CHAT domain-containing protein [Scytonematopsis contorta HA4267-MV1]
MVFQIKKSRWLYISLSIITMLTVFAITPVKASPAVTTPALSFAQSINMLSEGRKLYSLGRFAEAVKAWETAAQQYQAKGERMNEALSLSYLSLAQQELNQWEAAEKSIEQSVKILQTANYSADAIIWAQILNTKANLELRKGRGENALTSWQQAQKYYEQAGDTIGSLGSQINQAQALQSLGFYRRSKKQLEMLTQKLATMPDSEVKVSGLRSLGLALHAIGDSKSQQVLEQSLATANKIAAKTQLSSILSSLGKIASHQQDPEAALNYFEDAQTAATNPAEALQAGLARFKLLVDYNKLEHAIPLAPQLRQQLEELPPSHSSLYAAINFVATLNRLENPDRVVPSKDLAQLMAVTVKSAQKIQDASAEAYALYQWGQLYRRTQQLSEAKELSEKALDIARTVQADNIIAQSAWQIGQLYKQQGNKPEAIAAYTEAVKSLQALRSDLVAINSDIQFSFRESVEPVYRELVGLLLDEQQPTQASLLQARGLIESLQIAELDNFFREACIDKARQIDQVDPTAAVIYPIILPDRLAVILSKTGQPLRYYATQKSKADIEQTLDNLLASLNPVSDSKSREQLTQQVHDWLIRPAEQDGALKDSKTLVFVLDGKLRNIPITALYDGKQYLIEKYAVALSPGLQLIAAQSLQQNKINAVVAGISESRAGFAALPAVELEVKQISQIVPSDLLLNQKFTTTALANRLKSSSVDVVHLATHGQFSSRLENTFLLTWDGQINVKELSELLKNRSEDSSKAIELLVLSACDTATGDDRAVLGLAGLAVKSGARSTVATLWPVKDKAAKMLMTSFYERLQQPRITKAEALRQAQINLIHQSDFRDPFFWSAFVLVGNWI